MNTLRRYYNQTWYDEVKTDAEGEHSNISNLPASRKAIDLVNGASKHIALMVQFTDNVFFRVKYLSDQKDSVIPRKWMVFYKII